MSLSRPSRYDAFLGFLKTTQMRLLGYFLTLTPDTLQVVEVSTSKTGKHGHAKCHFVAIDIFTGKKLEDIVPSSHNCDVRYLH